MVSAIYRDVPIYGDKDPDQVMIWAEKYPVVQPANLESFFEPSRFPCSFFVANNSLSVLS